MPSTWEWVAGAATGRPRSPRELYGAPSGPWYRGRRSCRPYRRYHVRRSSCDAWSPRVISDRATSSVDLFYFDQVRHASDHPVNLGAVGQHIGLADAAKSERAQRTAVLGLGGDGRTNLGDFELGHLYASVALNKSPSR